MILNLEPFHASDRLSLWPVWSIPTRWSRYFTEEGSLICIFYEAAHVAGWEPYNLHKLDMFPGLDLYYTVLEQLLIGSVLHRSWTAPHWICTTQILNSTSLDLYYTDLEQHLIRSVLYRSWAAPHCICTIQILNSTSLYLYYTDHEPVSYTHLRAHETVLDLVCRLLLEKKK